MVLESGIGLIQNFLRASLSVPQGFGREGLVHLCVPTLMRNMMCSDYCEKMPYSEQWETRLRADKIIKLLKSIWINNEMNEMILVVGTAKNCEDHLVHFKCTYNNC